MNASGNNCSIKEEEFDLATWTCNPYEIVRIWSELAGFQVVGHGLDKDLVNLTNNENIRSWPRRAMLAKLQPTGLDRVLYGPIQADRLMSISQ